MFVPVCLLDWKLFTLSQRHLVTSCLDLAGFIMVLESWDLSCSLILSCIIILMCFFLTFFFCHTFKSPGLLFDWTPSMYVIVLGIWRLSNSMTEWGREARRQTAGLCLLQLCVWITLKHDPPSLPSSPMSCSTELLMVLLVLILWSSLMQFFTCSLSSLLSPLSCYLSVSPSP